jgi:hypothetical protein
MRSRCLRLLAATTLLVAIFPATVAADAESNFRRDQSFQQKNFENTLNEWPELDANHPSRPMSDVLSLTPFNGQLVLHTKLPSTPMGQQEKLKIDSGSEWSIVDIIDGAAGSGSVVPTTFSLNQTQFNPLQTDTLIVQDMKGTFLNITKQTQTPTARKLIQMQIQYPNAAQNNPGLCKLMIMDQIPGRAGAPVIVHSDNFSGFTREHPIEADRYVRPLLHQLGQDAALAPDPMLAFEVFADQWTTDAATTAKINKLVADLAGGDFHQRTHAEHELANLDKSAAVVLMRLDRTKLTAEQNARIDKLLSPYLPISATSAADLRTDPSFLLNCLYSENIVIRKIALAQLQSVTKLTLNFDPAADAPTRNAAIPAILDTLIKSHIIPTN